jgi:hypothetical protein
MIDGNSVKWPKIKTILFSYAGGKSARNVIIQSALNVLGKAETYLRETRCDEADVDVPAGLKSGSKVGMSAWAAMFLSANKFNADNILKAFYHWAPVMLNKLEIIQGGAKKYYMERGRVKYEGGKIIREVKERKEEENKGVSSNSPAQVKMYWTDKILISTATLKRADNKAISVPILVLGTPVEENGYLSVVTGEITSQQLGLLLGTDKKTISVICAVDAIDKYTNKKNDQNPESVPLQALKGLEDDNEETGYEYSILGSDETNMFSVIYESVTDAAKQGTDYENVTATPEAGDDVERSLPKVSLDIDLSELLKMLKLDLSHINLLELLKGLNVDIGCLSEADRNKLKDVNIGSETQVKNNLTTDLKTYLNGLNTGADINCLNLSGLSLKDLFKLPQISITLPDIQKILFAKTLFRSYNIV